MTYEGEVSKNIWNIHTKLLEKSPDSDQFLNIISDEQVESVIRQYGGRTRPTIRRYREEMKDMGIIEPVPNSNNWIVQERHGFETNFTGDATKVTLTIDEGLRNQARSLGINLSRVLAVALTEEIHEVQDFVEQRLEPVEGEKESEFVMELFKKELGASRAELRSESEARKKWREEVFEKVFGHEPDRRVEYLAKKAKELEEALLS